MEPTDIRAKRLQAEKDFKAVATKAAQAGVVSQTTPRAMREIYAPKPSERDGNWFSNFGSSMLNFAAGAAGLPFQITSQIYNDGKDALEGTAETLTQLATGQLQREAENNEKARMSLSVAQDNLLRDYKAGKIDKTTYSESLIDLSNNFQNLSKANQSVVQRANPNQRVMDLIEVGLMPFAAGRLARGASLPAREMGVIAKFSDEAYNLVKRVPVVDDILRKRSVDLMLLQGGRQFSPAAIKLAAKQASGKTIAKELAAAYYLRYPLVIGELSGTAYHTLEAINSDGKASDAISRAAFTAFFAFKGGPLGAAISNLRRIGGGARSLVFGSEGMFDILGQKMGIEGSFVKYLDDVKKTNPERYKEIKESAEAMQEINLIKAGNNSHLAADTIFEYFKKDRGFTDLENFPIKSWEDLFNDFDTYYNVYEEVIKAAKAGLIDGLDKHQWRLLAIGTFDSGAKSSLIKELKKASGKIDDTGAAFQARKQVLDSHAAQGHYYTQNSKLWEFINKAIAEDNWEKAIKNITTGRLLDGTDIKVPSKVAKVLEDNGYFLVRPQKIAQEFVERGTGRKLVSKFATNAEDYTLAVEPKAIGRTVAGALRRTGLSPEDTSVMQYQTLTRNVAQNLADLANKNSELGALIASKTDAATNVDDAKILIHKLQEKASEPRMIFGKQIRSEVADIRLLSTDEIAQALNISKKAAQEVRRSIDQAYLQMPLQLRGLGDAVQDLNIRYNPAARMYSRAQSAFRYAWNPFFRTQEIVETEVLGQVVTGGKKLQLPGVNFVRGVFRKNGDEMDTLVAKLEDAGILSGTIYGEAADDAVLGRLTAVLSRSQKESLAGIADNVAKAKYPQLYRRSPAAAFDQLLVDDFDGISDMLRVVVQYPKRSALNSAMARTLNYAFFPMRYNLKVTALAATALSKQPAYIQIATIQGIFQLRDWLNSDEGMAWYSENSEAIQVMRWLTPIGSIDQVLKLLDDGPDAIGDLGMAGGLPFGVILQILDSQIEDFNLNTPYVDPKSGQVVPDFIPITSRAKVRTAMNDLIGSVFTYPGRILGLPGKSQGIRSITGNIVPTDFEEFKAVTREEDLTDRQKEFQRVVKELNGINSTAPGTYQGHTLPPGPIEDPVAIEFDEIGTE